MKRKTSAWQKLKYNGLMNWRWWVALPILITIYLIVFALQALHIVGEIARTLLETEHHPFGPIIRFVRKGWTV